MDATVFYIFSPGGRGLAAGGLQWPFRAALHGASRRLSTVGAGRPLDDTKDQGFKRNVLTEWRELHSARHPFICYGASTNGY